MPAIIVPKPFKKILVLGPIYDKTHKLPAISDLSKDYDWIVFNGDICYPGELCKVKPRIDQIREFLASYKAIYLAGRLDYLFAGKTNNYEVRDWIYSLPNIAIFDFQTRPVLIMDGGIPKNIYERSKLMNNLELSFVSNIDNKPWHDSYYGCFGLVISNNPLTDKWPQHYTNSMQLGNVYNAGAPICAQEVGEIGTKPIILV